MLPSLSAVEAVSSLDEELGLAADTDTEPQYIIATRGAERIGDETSNVKPFSLSLQHRSIDDEPSSLNPAAASASEAPEAPSGRPSSHLVTSQTETPMNAAGKHATNAVSFQSQHLENPDATDVSVDGDRSSVHSEDSQRKRGRFVSFFLENLGFRRADDSSSVDTALHVAASDVDTATSGAAGTSDGSTDDALKLAVELVLRNPYMSTAEKMGELKDLHASIRNVAQAPEDAAAASSVQESGRFDAFNPRSMRGAQAPVSPEGRIEESPGTAQDNLGVESSHNQFARVIMHRRGSRAGSISEHIMQSEVSEPAHSSPQLMRKLSLGESTPPPVFAERFRASSLLNDAIGGADQGGSKDPGSTLATSTLGTEVFAAESNDIASRIQDLFLDDRVHKIQEIFRSGQTRLREVKLTQLSAELDEECSAIDGANACDNENNSIDGGNWGALNAKFSVRGKSKGINLKLFGNGNIGDMWNFNRMNFPTIFGEEDDGDDETSTAVHKSTLFIRRHSIWMAFYTEDFPVRAIVMSDRVIVFLPSRSGASSEKFMLQVQSVLPVALEGWKRRCGLERSSSDLTMNRAMQSGVLPFELEVFRNIVYIVGSKHRKEYIALKKRVGRYLELLKVLKEGRRPAILSMGLESHSMDLRSEMERMVMHINSNMEALNEVVDSENCDQYLALMNLSIFKKIPSLYHMNDQNKRRSILADEMRRHSDLHSLQSTVDQYIMDAESVLSKVDQLLKHVHNEESQFRLQLNFTQNQILLLNTVLTIFACAVAFGSYFTGIFGMNLDNTSYFEDQSHSFVIVFGGTFTLIFALFYTTLWYFTSRGVLPVIAGRRAARAAVAAKAGGSGGYRPRYQGHQGDLDDLDRSQSAHVKERKQTSTF